MTILLACYGLPFSSTYQLSIATRSQTKVSHFIHLVLIAISWFSCLNVAQLLSLVSCVALYFYAMCA